MAPKIIFWHAIFRCGILEDATFGQISTQMHVPDASKALPGDRVHKSTCFCEGNTPKKPSQAPRGSGSNGHLRCKIRPPPVWYPRGCQSRFLHQYLRPLIKLDPIYALYQTAPEDQNRGGPDPSKPSDCAYDFGIPTSVTSASIFKSPGAGVEAIRNK